MQLRHKEIVPDNWKMKQFISERIPEDGVQVVLADGPEGGPAWADLNPVWVEGYGWDLYFETNEPEWVCLTVIYQHFRCKDLSWGEWLGELKENLRKRPRTPYASQLHRIESARIVTSGNQRDTLTVRDTASILHCSISFVYKLMASHKLAYEMRGRRKLPTAISVTEYREQNLIPANHPVPNPRKPFLAPYKFKHLFQRKKSDL